ncbi:hypothetical protein INR49_021990, partial [Caranx melampygus]
MGCNGSGEARSRRHSDGVGGGEVWTLRTAQRMKVGVGCLSAGEGRRPVSVSRWRPAAGVRQHVEAGWWASVGLSVSAGTGHEGRPAALSEAAGRPRPPAHIQYKRAAPAARLSLFSTSLTAAAAVAPSPSPVTDVHRRPSPADGHRLPCFTGLRKSTDDFYPLPAALYPGVVVVVETRRQCDRSVSEVIECDEMGCSGSGETRRRRHSDGVGGSEVWTLRTAQRVKVGVGCPSAGEGRRPVSVS